MSDIKTIRIAGLGGQGIMRSGQILGKALVFDGYFAVQMMSYGTESRGGYAKTDLIFSKDIVEDLNIESFDYIIFMSHKAYNVYKKFISPGTILILDNELKDKITVDVDNKIYWINAIRDASEIFGNVLFANMILVGVIASLMGIPSIKSLERAIDDVLKRYTEKNKEALRYGFSMLEKLES